MRIRPNAKLKAAVKIAAALFIAVLIVGWSILAFLTTNEVGTYDFEKYTATRLVAGEEKIGEEGFYGIYFAAEKGKCAEKLEKIDEENKLPFVMLPDKTEEAVALAEECMEEYDAARMFFCAENREVLERLLTETDAVFCLWVCSSSVNAFFGAKMGYNCALPIKKATAKTVERAHGKEHLFVATGIKNEEEVNKCKEMKVDYAFVTSDYRKK